MTNSPYSSDVEIGAAGAKMVPRLCHPCGQSMKRPPEAPEHDDATATMQDMIDIADVARQTITIEAGSPSARPYWIAGRSRPLAHQARNPLRQWQTMQDVAVRLWRLRDVVLDAATMLVLQDGSPIRQSNYHRTEAELGAARPEPARIIAVDSSLPVLICGDAWATNHYHFLNHVLPAIDAGVAQFGPRAIMLATPPLRPVHEAVLPLLGHDVPPRLTVEPGRQYAIKDALFCDFSVGRADFSTSPFVQALHARLAACVPETPDAGRRLYISRQNDTHRRAAGEATLIEGLARRRFTIARPAERTLPAQIALFRNATTIVAPHGAGLANISFCRPGVEVYEFLPTNFVDPSILNLAVRAQLRPWIDAFPGTSDALSHTADWALDVPAILARTEEITGRASWWRR